METEKTPDAAPQKKRKRLLVVAFLVLGALMLTVMCIRIDTVTDEHDPEVPPDEVFVDDPVPAKPPAFDPDLVDSRKLDEWEVNKSAAVLRLDIRPIRPEGEANLQKIYPNFQMAVDFGGKEVIPSVNLLDSKCKQFDDALYAAVDLAAFEGVKGQLTGLKDILKRLKASAKSGTPVALYLEAVQQLAKGLAKSPSSGQKKPGTPPTLSEEMLNKFFADELASRPIGFYTWTRELRTLYRTERFLAQEFGSGSDLSIPAGLAEILRSNPQLLADYKKFVGLFRKLTNPTVCLSLDELPAGKFTPEVLKAEAEKRGVRHAAVSFLPPSTSRENELFERLALPATADLMRELVKRIKSGEIDLAPNEKSGWYERQVYALETLLLPGKGQEKGKLIYTARYKLKMLESFKAMITRRRETHLRQLPFAKLAAKPPRKVRPRLRVEPAPTYYLRTARAYAFVGNLLRATFGDELEDMYGYREWWIYGQVPTRKFEDRDDDDLGTELDFMRRLFYGLYLVSCEDIGLAPRFAAGEKVAAADCREAALNWIETFRRDPDLKPDARVCVPVYNDNKGTRFWAVVGVRLARLEAEYVHPPSIRTPGGQWQKAGADSLAKSDYLIPVDAFLSFTLKGRAALERREFWQILTEAGTRDHFLKAIGKYPTRQALMKHFGIKERKFKK